LPFDPNQIIPQEVQTKADEIVRLRGLFDAMDENNRPALPAGYECPISLSIISIPVFDASHPAVQAAFLPGATVALNNRDNRHPIDLNEYIRNGTVGLNNDRCSICRHQPALHRNAAFNPYMRIDSALQDEILQFLRAVPGINNAATTT
jgi:hypothetical protein